MRRMRKNIRSRIVKSKIPVPFMSDKTMVKLNYDTQVIMTIPTGSAEITTTVPMSYIDGTGFSFALFPSGLLNWANFYGAFRVLGSKIRAEFFPTTGPSTATGTVPVTCAVFPSEGWVGGTSPTATVSAVSQAYCRYKNLYNSGQGNGPSNHTIMNYISSKKMFGQRVTEENDFQQVFTYTGAVPNVASALSNPAERIEWVLSAQTADRLGVSSNATVLVNVKVTYYVSLEDRLNQPQYSGPSA